MKGDKAHYFRSNAEKAEEPRTIQGGQVRDRIVVVAGASSVAGRAAAAALVAAGARVVAVGSNAERLADVPAQARYVCDLTDAVAVAELADLVRAEIGRPDGLVHLVGGWRAGHDAESWEWLEKRLITTLRNTTVAFRDDLLSSSSGRLAIVSSTSVDLPTWANANYAAAKAAAEAWVKAMATSFTHTRRTARVPGGTGGTVIPFDAGVVTAAAVTFVVRALGTGEGKVPEEMLANAISGMWDLPSDELNGARVSFTV